MRKVAIIVLIFSIIVAGCSIKKEPIETDRSEQKGKYSEYERYRGTFFGTFDTMIQVVAYTKSEEEFQKYFDQIKQRFEELHRLYDIFNNYEGLNNLKTINDNAGIQPVKVNQDIIDLLVFSKEWYDIGRGKTNIAMGSVLEIWHKYREEGAYDPSIASLPPMELLEEAAQHMDINKIIIDRENSTVFLADKHMKLNVGAVAKGFATERVANEIKEAGLASAIISAGGNVRVLDKPFDGVRDYWGVGIQNPDSFIALSEEHMLDTVFLNNASIVTSGTYQRYYVVDGEIYHHLIDPDTLMPPNHYRAVTVVIEDSGLADFLSTVVFALPYEESRAFVEQFDGLEALWIMPDNEIRATEGMERMLKSNGATGAAKD